MPDPTIPASAPMSAIEIASNPRLAPSAAAATRIRSLRSGSRRRGDDLCAAIWSLSHLTTKVASEYRVTFGSPEEASVDFAESGEHRALRAAVAEIAQDFGPRYYAERAAERRPCQELWTALGQAGFIGVNIPEAYGGGGGGLTELALVCEEIAAAGTPLLLGTLAAALTIGVISQDRPEGQRGC